MSLWRAAIAVMKGTNSDTLKGIMVFIYYSINTGEGSEKINKYSKTLSTKKKQCQFIVYQFIAVYLFF